MTDRVKAEYQKDQRRIVLGDEVFSFAPIPPPEYVISTWVRTAKEPVKAKYRFSSQDYMMFYPEVVGHTVRDSHTHTMGIFRKGAAETLCHGWLCYQGNVVLWGYVPVELRNFGLFQAMCEVLKCRIAASNSNKEMVLATLPRRKPLKLRVQDHLVCLVSASYNLLT